MLTNIIKKQITIDYIEECFFQRKAEWEYLKEYDIIFDNILVNAINMIRLKNPEGSLSENIQDYITNKFYKNTHGVSKRYSNKNKKVK